MDELPELPFKQVLNHLNLKDRLRARSVSRAWRNRFDRYPVNTLCYSSRSSGFIFEKNRWVSGAFIANFISTTRFASFFATFGKTTLSSLKYLRLCDLDMTKRDPTAFAPTLNGFGQLEQLDIIRVRLNHQDLFKLKLPMLTSLQFEGVKGIENLTLKAPRLRRVKILDCSSRLRLEIIHKKSVERLLVDWLASIDVEKLKNLRYLYVAQLPLAISRLLLSLQQLKEIHTNHPGSVSELFKQKKRSGHADLKIYLWGLLLNGPDDAAIKGLNGSSSSYLSAEWLVCLAENTSRLANQIPFYRELNYSAIVVIAPGLDVDLLKRFTDFNKVTVDCQVRDIQRFLDLLKNCENISKLSFTCDQPQDLFDRLPEHCAIQKLTIMSEPSDLAFLFRLKHLIHLDLYWSIGIETIRRAFDELPALSTFEFEYNHKKTSIKISQPKQFQVSGYKQKTASNLKAAIEFIVEN